MNKIVPVFCLSLAIVILGCTQKYSHVKKTKNTYKQNVIDCDPIIKKNAEIDDALGDLVGTFSFKKTAFTKKCSEMEIIQFLIRKACELNADIINLKELKKPNKRSWCFQCTAELIKLNDSISKELFVSSSDYTLYKISERTGPSPMEVAKPLIGLVLGVAFFASLIFIFGGL